MRLAVGGGLCGVDCADHGAGGGCRCGRRAAVKRALKDVEERAGKDSVGKWLMFLPPMLFAALAVMFYVGMTRENPDELPSVFIGKQAPAADIG